MGLGSGYGRGAIKVWIRHFGQRVKVIAQAPASEVSFHCDRAVGSSGVDAGLVGGT